MRRFLLLAVLVTATAPPASAAACAASADQPYTAGAGVIGSGEFFCSPSVPEGYEGYEGMTVTVCIESAPVVLPLLWTVENCVTETAGGFAHSAQATVFACVQTPTPVLVRTTAEGSNAAGATGHMTSAPTWAPGFGSCGP